MAERFIEVLLIEDNSAYARLIKNMVAEFGASARYPPFHLATCHCLADGLEHLRLRPASLVLLDLTLPDSDGLDTFEIVTAAAPDVPVVVLTGSADESLARQALQAGAQDYIVKGESQRHPLLQAMWYAIERQRLLTELRAQSMTDPLTGLYNRRGFFALAEQQLRLAERGQQSMLLLFADLADLKRINDNGGHTAGDRALQSVANALRETFRDSDIVGRLGGDEFAVLAIGAADESAATLTERLSQSLEIHNALNGAPVVLSLGFADYNPDKATSIETLVSQADAAMYRNKHVRDAH